MITHDYVIRMEGHDLTELLNAWKFDPEHNVRTTTASDGRTVIQVRLPLGIEQYEIEGRPDGARPKGHETVLASIEVRLREHIITVGSDHSFVITPEEVEELQAEGILFYYRYILLFQLDRFSEVIRDTEHNLSLCDMLERYCPRPEERDSVLQYRPFIIRLHAAAQAGAIRAGDRSGDANELLKAAINQIESLPEVESPVFQLEQHRSISYLQELLHNDPPDELKSALEEAVQQEDYERAAILRDQLQARDVKVDKER